VLLEGTPSDINMAALRDRLEALPGVRDVHDLHVWTLTSGYNAMSAHLVIAADNLLKSVLTEAHSAVTHDFNIRHVTVQVEPEGWRPCESHL
jgi:cobalt-zinc-cadmium efflux system protein